MVSYRQDAAPPGGYDPIDWAKRAPKRLFSGTTHIVGFIGITTLAWVAFIMKKKTRSVQELEMRDARVAIEPFIMAEKDRAILKHYRRNRDEENELMKNVQGWKTGTLYGTPVYHNIRDRYIKPSLDELMAHMSRKDRKDFTFDKMYR